MAADSDDPTSFLLYRFRSCDPVTKRWSMSRYRATLEDIAAQHDKWELTDEPPETRHHEADCVGNFSWDKIPLRSHSKAQRPVCNADMQPRGDNLRELEAFLLHVFLRRYATWRVRTRRYAQAQGAAILAREFRV